MQKSILYDKIAACRLCPRLVRYRESVKPAKRFADWQYWHKPALGFGDINARVLIVGLAPSAHGGNRTGRVFTGDPSGDFLFDAIYKAGFSNQPRSVSRDDGLTLKDLYVTAVVKCAPPDNKPERIEAVRCVSAFLMNEVLALKKARVIVPLGAFAHKWLEFSLAQLGVDTSRVADFGHGAEYTAGRYTILTSYHVSPRNTNTGTLTERMFVGVLKKARSIASRTQ
ncbi:MAG: uracil-DNA glycosylase [Candidatus Micrarchaeota archaeon]|nr:uracil-DNA glycosylase [Candidatus Micrarchaeota archaeon]